MHGRHFELLNGEPDDVTYDDDDNQQLWEDTYMDRDCSGSEGLQITDSAKNFLKVLKEIKPPLCRLSLRSCVA